MFCYVGLLVARCAVSHELGLIAAACFGTKGFVVALRACCRRSLLRSSTVQTGIPALWSATAYDFELRADDHHRRPALHRGHLHRRAGPSLIGFASVPLFVILGLFVAFHSTSTTTSSSIIDYAGADADPGGCRWASALPLSSRSLAGSGPFAGF